MATKPDQLNRTVTEIARKLISGSCNARYRVEFSALFIDNPGFVDDVDPSLRGDLEAILSLYRDKS